MGHALLRLGFWLSKVTNRGAEQGVSSARIWKRVLGVEQTVVESVEFDADDAGVLVVGVRVSARRRRRCPHCGRRCPGFDQGGGRRRWRGLDVGSARVFLEAEARRVTCRKHGVVVAAVPWARHGSWFTAAFEDQVAWLAAHAPKSAVQAFARVSWRAVTGAVERVVGEARGRTDRLAGLTRVGIDEKSYRKGHKYLTVVTDHDTGRVVWTADGRSKATVGAFFTALGPQRAATLTHVSADGADWIHTVVAEHAPQAVICLDPFHVVAWATKALDEVRRRIVRELKAAGRGEDAAALKGSRWAVLKNPDTLTGTQQVTMASGLGHERAALPVLPDQGAAAGRVRGEG